MLFAARLAAVVAFAALFAPPAAAASFGPSQPLFVRTGFVPWPLGFTAAGDEAGNGIAVVRSEVQGDSLLVVERPARGT
jgi:hypothetical protein